MDSLMIMGKGWVIPDISVVNLIRMVMFRKGKMVR
jgi:hypothetical protein